MHYNQNGFLNYCQSRKTEVKITINGKTGPVIGAISKSDQFTIIVNDEKNQFEQQKDFLEYSQNKLVKVTMANGQEIEAKLTSSDIFTVILNDSILLFKSAISMIECDKISLFFKNNIIAVVI